MEYRRLGKSGLKVSELSFGSWVTFGKQVDGGDAVSSEYKPKFEFKNGEIIKVVFDVANDAYIDVEQKMAAALARD